MIWDLLVWFYIISVVTVSVILIKESKVMTGIDYISIFVPPVNMMITLGLLVLNYDKLKNSINNK